MRRAVTLVFYGLVGLALIGYLGMWLFAGGLGLLGLQGEMEGARQDFMSALLMIGGIGGSLIVSIILIAKA